MSNIFPGFTSVSLVLKLEQKIEQDRTLDLLSRT